MRSRKRSEKDEANGKGEKPTDMMDDLEQIVEGVGEGFKADEVDEGGKGGEAGESNSRFVIVPSLTPMSPNSPSRCT